MCLVPNIPSPPPPVELPDPVAPIEPPKIETKAPPPPEKTATYYGSAKTSKSSPSSSGAYNSLRIRRTPNPYMELNIPNA